MPTVGSVKTNPKKKPFFKDSLLTLQTNECDGMLISFECAYKGQRKVFKVTDYKITEAWQQMEKWFKNLKIK